MNDLRNFQKFKNSRFRPHPGKHKAGPGQAYSNKSKKETENEDGEQQARIQVQHKHIEKTEADRLIKQQRRKDIGNCNKNINDAKLRFQKASQEYIDKTEAVNVLDEEINNFDTYKKVELEKLSTNIGLAKAKRDFDLAEEAIKSAIELTSVHEDDVERFLNLTKNLLPGIVNVQKQAATLSFVLS